jgi:hypothetical protein
MTRINPYAAKKEKVLASLLNDNIKKTRELLALNVKADLLRDEAMALQNLQSSTTEALRLLKEQNLLLNDPESKKALQIQQFIAKNLVKKQDKIAKALNEVNGKLKKKGYEISNLEASIQAAKVVLGYA